MRAVGLIILMIFCLPVCFFPLQADETSESGEGLTGDSIVFEILEARYDYKKFIDNSGKWNASGTFWFKAYCKNMPYLKVQQGFRLPQPNLSWPNHTAHLSDDPIENDTVEYTVPYRMNYRWVLRFAIHALTEEEKNAIPSGHEFYMLTMREFMSKEDSALMGTPAVTGIRDTDGPESIHLSKADGKITITAPANNKIFNVTITTVQGHTAGTYIGDSSCLEIPLADLPKGLLIVSVRSDSDSRTFKIFN